MFELLKLGVLISNVWLSFAATDFCQIRIVDEDTGRGVPLVELETVNQQRYVTDSAGLVALQEPAFFGREIYFHIRSHGYEVRADGFGYRGARWKIERGEKIEFRIKRLNIAERLYRITGAGQYRDSVLLQQVVPIKEPLLNAQVFGSDSVLNSVYRGRLYWFWGDTHRPNYPLGNFHVPGATSDLPTAGGLDPAQGVDLKYFVAPNGFAKETCRMPGDGPTWIDSLVTLNDGNRERLFAHYVKVKPPLSVYAGGFAEFNDAQEQFEHRTAWPTETHWQPSGHVEKHTENGVERLYFAHPYPYLRVAATPDALLSADHYEAWSYLKSNGSAGKSDVAAEVERDAAGKLVLSWKRADLSVTAELEQKLLKSGQLRADDPLLFAFTDKKTQRRVVAHRGSVAWNAYRKCWTMIFVEVGGTSVLGEVWYAEAPEITGPWCKATKVLTHDRYSFYNPKQHPVLAPADGRFLYFEGTYTDTFSGNNDRITPWYNYNQMMYRLDLSDRRLHE